MTHVPYPGCYCADCVEGPTNPRINLMSEVSQEAREAAENFMNAHGWLCEEDWSLVLEADREVIVKFFAKFEQSIRQQAERAFEERERKLREALKEISELHGEINPSNYDHDDAYELNRQFCYALTVADLALKETPDAQ